MKTFKKIFLFLYICIFLLSCANLNNNNLNSLAPKKIYTSCDLVNKSITFDCKWE